jgi:hypothetical protein
MMVRGVEGRRDHMDKIGDPPTWIANGFKAWNPNELEHPTIWHSLREGGYGWSEFLRRYMIKRRSC